MSRRAGGVVGALVTILLLWWVLRDVSPAAVLAEIRGASPWWLLTAVVLATFSFVVRAFRWKVLLEPGHDGSSFEARFGATCAGFAANNIFPARLGEIVRAWVLARVAALPFGVSVGSLVVERVLDGLVLATFLVVPILTPGFPLGDAETAQYIRRVALVGTIVFATGFVVLWLIARRPEAALDLWERSLGRLVPQKVRRRVSDLVRTIFNGLGALARLGVLLRAVAWSFAMWLCLGASIWAGLLAFDVRSPGFVGALFVQAVIGFAVAAPSTPGFFGLFEAGARVGLSPWDVPADLIISFATSYHILTFIPVTLMGLWYLRRVGLRWSDVRGSAAAESGPPDSAETPGLAHGAPRSEP